MKNINLDWIKNIVEEFNKLPKTRKNLIEIAGYPSWENVNSNLLAFYLDVENNNDEHGFSTLFFDSLLDLLEMKLDKKFVREIFNEDSFTVQREVITNKNKRIDILLQSKNSKDCAIIIENKIYADLYNDLVEYWDSVDSENKIGVILSISNIDNVNKIIKKLQEEKEEPQDDIIFCNITHKEFVESVSNNLTNHYLNSNDRHLLFLKEYMANINSLYKNKEVDMAKDNVLKKFHENKENINKFFEVDNKLSQHVCDSFFEVMKKFGFPAVSESYSKAKHFEFDENSSAENIEKFDNKQKEILGKFRFWVSIDELKYDSQFYAGFELFDTENEDNTKYGDMLKNKLESLDVYSNEVTKSNQGNSQTYYQWIYELRFKVTDYLDHSDGFKGKLEEEISKHFFEHENNFIEHAVNNLDEIIKNNSKS